NPMAPGLWRTENQAAPPAEDRLYGEATRRGGFLLTVKSDDAEASRVYELLESSNAVDMVERETELKAAGFAPPVTDIALPAAPTSADETIDVVEERLLVGKRQVDRGGVRVRAYVVETPVSEQVALREEHVGIQRRSVNEPIADVEALFQERTMELTETAEEAVIGKETHIVEEIVVHKEAAERVETVSDSVRHTEVEVEQIGRQELR
ncbi:MAG: YsnF/AvaK domain-containing protein, partial [Caulobacteraceae bacterium]